MGINVYPVTKNPAQLEKLVGVPEGTINSLREFEKRNPALIDPEANSDDRYKAYCLLDEYQEQMRTLADFSRDLFRFSGDRQKTILQV